MEIARYLLLEFSVPSHFWVDAIHTIVHLTNMQTTPILGNQSPFFALYRKSPNYMNLHIFGCVWYALLLPHERHKLSTKATKCVFIGYSDKTKGYICYDPRHHRIRVSHNVIFFRSGFFLFHL